jgi:type IX secretion system PorP/SprF family membrane protein
MKKIIVTIFVSFFFVPVVVAQDVHLSQFYTSDHLLNPAKVGDYEGDYRFIGNYRNQWRQIPQQTPQSTIDNTSSSNSPLNTYVVSFDRAFHYYSHDIDGGILVLRDQFTGFNTVTTKILLTAGYGYLLKGHKLRVGLQGGLVSNSTDLSLQTFPNQWDYQNGIFNQKISAQENTLNRSQKYFDMNIGVQWSKRFKKLEPKTGFALDHVNRPKDTYFSTTAERLRMLKVFHAELNYFINNKLTLQPKLLWMWTDNANDMVFGSNLKYNTNNKIIPSVFVGALYRSGADRNTDALIPVAGFSYKRFDLGFSYDVNVSTLSAGTTRARTFEFSIIYTGASSKPKFIALPCDRY